MPAPASLLRRVAYRAQRIAARFPLGAARHCCLCNRRVARFLPFPGGWEGAPPILLALQVVGSDLDWYLCPACGSNDRERHLAYYFRQLGLFEQIRNRAVIHFAPEPVFGELVRQAKPARLVRADLFPGGPDIEKVDLLDICHPDASFDFVIANHVLEHVADDARALAELRRVLRPGGTAILQTPYSPLLEKTICDPGVTSAAARLQLYGQEDHARLYGRDIFARFAAAGFVDRVVQHDVALPEIDPRRGGVNRREPLFRFERN